MASSPQQPGGDAPTAVAPPPSARPPDERVARAGIVTRLLRRPEIGAVIGAIAVFMFFALASDVFATVRGAARWTDVASTLGIMAVAVALLMIGGEFDLSAGVMIGTTGLLIGLLVGQLGFDIWSAMLVSLLFAMAIGMANGLLVVKTGLPSFIVTLGTFFVLRGVNLGYTKLITDQVRVTGIDRAEGYEVARRFLASSFWEPYNFRVSLLWWIGLTALATWVLLRTKIGNWIFSVGGDKVAARSVGVPVNRVKIALFMTTASAAWLVGTMTALRLRSAQASEGVGQEFEFIIAAVVGGNLLTGGYGSTIGAAFGALIMGMATIGIPFAGWNTDWRWLFMGVVLLLAVLLNNFVRKKAQEARR